MVCDDSDSDSDTITSSKLTSAFLTLEIAIVRHEFARRCSRARCQRRGDSVSLIIVDQHFGFHEIAIETKILFEFDALLAFYDCVPVALDASLSHTAARAFCASK